MRQRFLLASMTMLVSRRASALCFPRHACRDNRPGISTWNRQVNYATTTLLQVKHREDDNRDTWQPLTRTEIRKLRLAAMREELAKRGLDTSGTRPVLMTRLLDTVEKVPSKRSKIQKEATTTTNDTCPPLDSERQYVFRTKGHTKMAYNSSGIGIVLYDADSVREVWVARKYFPRTCTPFETDYKAAITGLESAYKHGARNVVLQVDNNVIVKQVTGEYIVKKPKLKELCTALQGISSKFSNFEMMFIPAAENSRAKNLAQRAVGTKKTIGLPEDGDNNANDSDEGEEVFSNEQVYDSIPETLPNGEDATDEHDFSDFDENESPTVISPEKTYLLQFDGGARGNPGIAGSGMVLYDPDNMEEVWCGWKYLGDNTTNNAAEYAGLLLGIQCARSLGVRHLRAEGDSLLIVKHVTGVYKAREQNLKKLLHAVNEATRHLDSFEIEHIPRAANKRADELANQAMDTHESFGFDELD